jgi:hypothetical protein
MNFAKLRMGAGQGDVKQWRNSPGTIFQTLVIFFISPFARFQENGILTWRQRAFYSRSLQFTFLAKSVQHRFQTRLT